MLTCISTAQPRTKYGPRVWSAALVTCKFLCKVALLQCWHAFRLRRLVSFWSHSGLQHFTCEFPYEVALLQCWHAFRLRRLAQSVCLRSGLTLACGILPVNFRIKLLFCNLDMHFGCSVCLRSGFILVCGLWPVNFGIKWLLWNPQVHFNCVGSHKVCVLVSLCGLLPENFRIKWLLWHVQVHFDCAGSH